MTGVIDARLQSLGVDLPKPTAPVANYVPYVRSGALVYVSGQISMDQNGPILGRLGDTMDIASGAAAAKRCGMGLLAHLRNACGGDLDKVVRVVKLTGFVNSTADFVDQPKVINGCSDFLVEVFGDVGRHARSAVSVASLPFGVAVEIEGIFEVL